MIFCAGGADSVRRPPVGTTSHDSTEPSASRSWRGVGFAVVRILLGAVLLGAAVLKVLWPGDAFSFGSSLDWLSEPTWRLAAAEIEALLGVWLLTGLWKRALWWAALLWFCGLAGASLYLGVVGQPTCGCFGSKLPLSPWYAFGLDLAAVAALFLFQPPQVWRIDWVDLRRLLLTAAGAGGILAVLAGGLTWAYGSPGEALIQLRGESITVEPRISDVGDVQAPDVRSIPIRLVNHTDHPVCVYGGKADCSCVVWDDLPVMVPPHGDQSVTIRILFRGSPKPVKHSFLLFTDAPSQTAAYGEVRAKLTTKRVHSGPPGR
jgi:hypothetical protein